MTKQESMTLKKMINQEKYTTYFSAKRGTMSVRVYSYINNNYDKEAEKTAIEKVLNLTSEMFTQYEIKRRTYQGFIHDTDLIFS